MSNQDDTPNSLLRRLLHGSPKNRTPDDDPPPNDSEMSPLPEPRTPARDDDTLRSPIRPAMQNDTKPQDMLMPSLPGELQEAETPREQMQRAEEALISLREKMSLLAAEFANGKINRAQFDAIYTRYSEQRDITERLLARDPESQAWQSVVQTGHTQFLRSHYESRIVSYAIYNQETQEMISLTGQVQLSRNHARVAIQRLRAVIGERGSLPAPALRMMDDGRGVLFVPGYFSAVIVIFSREPSLAQIERIRDIHADFERANQHALTDEDYQPNRLVYPHRALFEENRF